jgi:hypothetical protein
MIDQSSMPPPKGKKLNPALPRSQASQRRPFGRWFLGEIFSAIRRHTGLVVPWLVVAYISKHLFEALALFAGKQSNANLNFSFWGHVSVVWSISITLAGFSAALYWRERRLHRATRERLTQRDTNLELKLDTNRTSSLLTSKGTTRKEDQ